VKKTFVVLVLLILFGTALPLHSAGEAPFLPEAPVKGMVTMLDLGAGKCIPCKMMTPIVEELRKEYEGRAAILFIDVWEHQDVARKYGIQSIPTQIFYDREGREVARHEGFLDKKSIVAKLQEMGVK
jgi:thioredoxin 1